MLYVEVDLAACVEPKQFHDVVGYYNRFDVFHLEVDHTARRPVVFRDGPEQPPEASPPPGGPVLDGRHLSGQSTGGVSAGCSTGTT